MAAEKMARKIAMTMPGPIASKVPALAIAAMTPTATAPTSKVVATLLPVPRSTSLRFFTPILLNIFFKETPKIFECVH